jgi:cell division septal protein FtsQ
MQPEHRKSEPPKTNPADLEQLLEIELMQKRAAWKQAKARRGSLRALSFFFLFLVIVGALLAFFFLMSPERVSELKATGAETTQSSPSPTVGP